ncbi:MAG: hypothetical protein RL885_00885 [Planctomycetota bacterium]
MPSLPVSLLRIGGIALAIGALVLSCESPLEADRETDPARAALISRMERLSARFGVTCEHCHVDFITYDRNGTGAIAELMMESPDFAGPDWLHRTTRREEVYECRDCHVPSGKFFELTDEGRLTAAMIDVDTLMKERTPDSEENR